MALVINEDPLVGMKVVAADPASVAKIKAVDPDGTETAKAIDSLNKAIDAKESGGDLAAALAKGAKVFGGIATKFGIPIGILSICVLSGCGVAPAKKAAETAILNRFENTAANVTRTIDALQDQHVNQVREHAGDLLTWKLDIIDRAATEQKSTPREIIAETMKSVALRDEKIELAKRQNAEVKATIEAAVGKDLQQAYELHGVSKLYNDARIDPLKLIANIKAKMSGSKEPE